MEISIKDNSMYCLEGSLEEMRAVVAALTHVKGYNFSFITNHEDEGVRMGLHPDFCFDYYDQSIIHLDTDDMNGITAMFALVDNRHG